MKKRQMLFGIIAVVGVILGCNKTTYYTNNNIKPQGIYGKWYINKSIKAIYFYGSPVLQDTTTSYTSNDYIQFNADGTGVVTDTLPGMPDHNFNFIYTPKDSTHVFLYEYLNTPTAIADTMTLTLYTPKAMNWYDSFTTVSIDLTQTNTYSYFFTKAN